MSRSARGRGRLAVTAVAVAAVTPAVFASAAPTAGAAVQPATLAVNKACYVLTRTIPRMTVTGSGYSPGDQVTISDSTGTVFARTAANAAGQILAVVRAPTPGFSAPGQKRDTITAEDFTLAGTEIKGVVTTRVAPRGAAHGATKRRPGLRALTEKASWSFSGFPVGRTIWAHYTIKGKQVARQSFGRAKGPCGVLKARRKLFPARPRHKSYPLQIDARKRYSRRTKPAVPLKVSLTFVF